LVRLPVVSSLVAIMPDARTGKIGIQGLFLQVKIVLCRV
jgi:hypothetical protein